MRPSPVCQPARRTCLTVAGFGGGILWLFQSGRVWIWLLNRHTAHHTHTRTRKKKNLNWTKMTFKIANEWTNWAQWPGWYLSGKWRSPDAYHWLSHTHTGVTHVYMSSESSVFPMFCIIAFWACSILLCSWVCSPPGCHWNKNYHIWCWICKWFGFWGFWCLNVESIRESFSLHSHSLHRTPSTKLAQAYIVNCETGNDSILPLNLFQLRINLRNCINYEINVDCGCSWNDSTNPSN